MKPSDDLKENITESGGEIQSGEVLTTDVESLSISEEVETENSQAESAVSPPSPTPQTVSTNCYYYSVIGQITQLCSLDLSPQNRM